MAQTSKLHLELPDGSDYAKVDDINGNMEIIEWTVTKESLVKPPIQA